MIEYWRNDWFLSRLLPSLSERIQSVAALSYPLNIIDGFEGQTVAIDYAFFCFMKSLSRSVSTSSPIDDEVVALFLYEIARNLISSRKDEYAYPILYRAVGLRSKNAVQNSTSIRESLFYQKAINIALIHEQAHILFSKNKDIRDLWVSKSMQIMDSFSDESRIRNTYPDQKTRADIIHHATRLKQNDFYVEEIACDIFSLENAIRQELSRKISHGDKYIEVYVASARILILSIYITRNIAKAASSITNWINAWQFGRQQDLEIDDKESFLAEMRIRIQILIVYATIINRDYKLREQSPNVVSLENRLKQQDEWFIKAVISAQEGFEQCQSNSSVIECLQIIKAQKILGITVDFIDCKPLLELYLNYFWYSSSVDI